MPFTANDLLEVDGKPDIVDVRYNDPVLQALRIMVENDFSQLPVVDDNRVPVGLITNDSILNGIITFDTDISSISIKDVIVEDIKTQSLEDNIFDILEELKRQPAVLITDNEDQLIGIVTNYDTTLYFRSRAEDMMLIEDAENTLKDYILHAYTDPQTGLLNDEGLQDAVNSVTDRRDETFRSFQRGVNRYIGRLGEKVQHDTELMREVCFLEFGLDANTKQFDDLSMGEFISLLLHPETWSVYEGHFGRLDRNSIAKRLDDVRNMRNRLAHFREELSRSEKRQLQDMVNWLQRYAPEPITPSVSSEETEPDTDEIAPVEEVIGTRESRYNRLGVHLNSLPVNQDRITLTFDEIEEIIEHELPPSAYQYTAWWSNNTTSHTQSQAWLSSGWRVAKKSLSEQYVIFARIKEREQAYIDFFSTLAQKIRDTTDLEVSTRTLHGTSWMNLLPLPREGRNKAVIACSFTRQQQCRIELYIDTGDKDENKYLYDSLEHQRIEIEDEVGTELTWERLKERRASRIAYYYDQEISVVDEIEKLEALQEWAIDAYVRMNDALAKRFEDLAAKID